MPIAIDDRMPLVLVAEMAAHIGAEVRATAEGMIVTFPEEPNALQNLIEKHHARRAQRQRRRLEPLAIEDLE
jgi:hypothetical protein